MIISNNYNLPSGMAEALDKQINHKPTKEKTIHVTNLIKPTKIVLLQERHHDALTADVSDGILAMIGSAGHAVLEKISKRNRLIEKNFKIVVNDYTISGTLDFYDKKTKALEDYKIVGWNSLKDEKIEWEQQLNIYAYMLRKNGFPVESLQINAIIRNWSRFDAYKSKDYPPIPFKRIDVLLWDITKQESFIQDRVNLYIAEQTKADDDLVVCTPDERWAKPSTWAVTKYGGKRALKTFDDQQSAIAFRTDLYSQGIKTFLSERKGSDLRCQYYCSAAPFCNYYKQKYANK